ncbi:MAG: hypothetical protein HFF18_10820 [Oscillospiraceae bacterium]|nr:hypothetical protein [Oscillospiraceae bacterium]
MFYRQSSGRTSLTFFAKLSFKKAGRTGTAELQTVVYRQSSGRTSLTFFAKLSFKKAGSPGA